MLMCLNRNRNVGDFIKDDSDGSFTEFMSSFKFLFFLFKKKKTKTVITALFYTSNKILTSFFLSI